MYVGETYNLSTIMNIDDYGILRLLGTYQEADFQHQVSHEFNVTTFKTTQKYIFPVSFIQVYFNTPFPEITNERDWVYYTNFG